MKPIYQTLKITKDPTKFTKIFSDLLSTPVEDELPEEDYEEEESLEQPHEKSALLETPQQYYPESEDWSQPQFKPQNPFQQPRYTLYPNQPNNFTTPPSSMQMRPPFSSPQNPRQGFQPRNNFHPNFRQSSNFRGGNMRGSPYFQKGGQRGGNFNGMGNRGNFNRGRGNFRGGPRW